MGRSSRSWFEAKSPTKESPNRSRTQLVLHFLEPVRIAAVDQEDHAVTITVVLAPHGSHRFLPHQTGRVTRYMTTHIPNNDAHVFYLDRRH